MKFDYITKGVYLGGGTSLARAQAVRDSLGSGPLTVELRDGETLVYSGTFAGPMTAGSDGSLSIDALLTGTVTTGGTPDAGSWTCRIRNADGRYVEGSFGPGGRFTFTAGSLVVGRAVRLAVSIAAAGGALPSWLTPLPTMTWAQIPSTRADSVLVDPAGRSLDRAFSWCGAALKHEGSELFMMTGGHDDGYSNSIYSLKLNQDSPAWVRRNEPSVPWTINASHNSDGTPTTCHTYWNIQFCQSRNLLMWFGRAAIQGSGNTNVSNVDAFDPVTNTYVPANTFPNVPVGMGVDRPIIMVGDDCYHQGNGGAATVSKWTSASGEYGSWSNVGSGSAFESGPAFVHDPVRERLTRIDATRPVHLSLSGTMTVANGTNYSGTTASKVREKCSAVYIPAIGSPLDDKYVVTEFGARLLGAPVDLHVVDPDTSAVTVASVSGTKPTLRSLGDGHTYGRLQYVPELKCLVLVAREDRDVHVMRLA